MHSQSGVRMGFVALVAVAMLAIPAFGQAVSPCDLNADGAVNNTDVTLAVNMSIGSATCAANIVGAGVCNAVVVQRVVNALGGTCVTGTARTVTLNWVASTSTNVVGYNVFRSTTDGGPYTLLTASPVAAVTFTDEIVQGGLTYYYVVTAVDSSGNSSTNSNQAVATIPVG